MKREKGKNHVPILGMPCSSEHRTKRDITYRNVNYFLKHAKILPKRAKVWEDNPTKQSQEKMGFKHYDLVKSKHRTRGWVIGSVRSLKEKVMTLRTKDTNDNFPVSYKKSIILQRFNRIIYY